MCCSACMLNPISQKESTLNLIELHPHRDCKVFRLLSHVFGVVPLYRTISNYISSGDKRCAGCNMHRFGEVQAHRTFSNFILTEIARYIDYSIITYYARVMHLSSAFRYYCVPFEKIIIPHTVQKIQYKM